MYLNVGVTEMLLTASRHAAICAAVVGLVVGGAGSRAATPTAPSPNAPSYNGGAQVSLRLVNLVLERQILQRQTVTDEVAGVRTVAETTTKGKLRAEFIPSSTQAIVDFRLVGDLSAPNATATRGSVTVRMASQTSIDARKRLIVTPNGLFPGPSEADCNTETEILDVEANRRVMERLGRRRAEKLRPEAQESANQQVAERVETELDSQAKDPVAEANKFYAEKLRLPLINVGGFPRDIRISTSASHVAIRLLAQQQGQSAPSTRMPVMSAKYDIFVCGHESLVTNMSEPLVGGKTFDDKQFLDVMKIMTGTAQRGLWVYDGRPRWNVTFAKKRPIQATFANGTFHLTYSFESVTCGADTVRAPLEASALYRPEITRDGVRLVRQSSPTIAFTDSMPDDDARTRVREQMTERFNAFFQSDLYFDGLSPPEGGTWAKLRELRLTELRCEDGWFTIGYMLNEPGKLAAQTK